MSLSAGRRPRGDQYRPDRRRWSIPPDIGHRRDRGHVGGDAVEGRGDDGVIELALRLVDLRLRLQVLRKLLNGNGRIAGEPRELHLRLLAQRLQRALVGDEREVRLVVAGLGNRAAMHQRGVAFVGGAIHVDLRLLRIDVAQHALVVLLHRVDGERDLGEVGLGIVERDLELPGIETVEDLARRHVLVVDDVDLLHNAGNVGGYADLVGVHIGIVGRHHLPARDVPVEARDQGERQQREQRRAPLQAPAAGARACPRTSRKMLSSGRSGRFSRETATGPGRCLRRLGSRRRRRRRRKPTDPCPNRVRTHFLRCRACPRL